MRYQVTDATRPEHLWLLLAAEVGRDVSCSLAPAAAAAVRSLAISLLGDELQVLLVHYRRCAVQERSELREVAQEALLEGGFQMVTTDDGSAVGLSLWADGLSTAAEAGAEAAAPVVAEALRGAQDFMASWLKSKVVAGVAPAPDARRAALADARVRRR